MSIHMYGNGVKQPSYV